MNRFAIMGVFPLLAVLCFSLPASACLWDNDTLETEAKGVPDAVRAITGRFERNPDLYYEMRLARVIKQLGSTPDKLELYDDAGVACDRLHRSDEAISWMTKKRAQIHKLRSSAKPGVLHTHRYRLLANEGTFVAHRWLRNGADRKHISEMKRARDLIAAAIKLNPDAHFGREKYQLKLMEWIISPPELSKSENEMDFPDFLKFSRHLEIMGGNENKLKELKQENAIKGLSGLIALGNAWQSVDVFYALKLALMLKGDSSAAYLAQYRLQELIDSDQSSLHPQAPNGEDLKARIASEAGLRGMKMWLSPPHPKPLEIKAFYKTLRAEADEWHAQRTAYMMKRLKAGRHPDWDESFWNEWQEPPAPSLYVPSRQEQREQRQRYLNIAAAMLGVLCATFLALRFAKKRRK